MLDGVGAELKHALEELRELARGLHPPSSPTAGSCPPCNHSRPAPHLRS
jgi:hypothetical protein